MKKTGFSQIKKCSRVFLTTIITICLVFTMITLPGCSFTIWPNPKADAIGAAIDELLLKYPSIYNLKIDNLDEALRMTSDVGRSMVTLNAQIIDPEGIAIDSIVSPGEVIDIPDAGLEENAKSDEKFLAATRKFIKSKVKNLKEIPAKDWKLVFNLSKDSDGYTAVFDEHYSGHIAAINDEKLVGAVALQSQQLQELAVRSNKSSWLSSVFSGASDKICSLVQILSVAPMGGSQYLVTFNYPNLDALYPKLAKVTYDSYISDAKKAPIFNEISQADFKQKLSDKTPDSDKLQDDRLSGSAVVSLAVSNEGLERHTAIPSESDLPTLTETSIPLTKALTIYPLTLTERLIPLYQSSVVTTDVVPADHGALLNQACAGYINDLNKSHVVKKQSRPKTKVIQGKNNGIALKILSKKNIGDTVVTFTKKGAKKPRLKAFVRKGSSLTVRLPAGTYTMVQGSGKTWYGSKYTYGPSGSYQKSSKKLKLRYGYTYTLTLYKIAKGNLPTTRTPYSY